jgi:phosphoglycolate phosphatase
MFDFDGTIADSMSQVLSSYNDVAAELGLTAIAADDVPRLRRLAPAQALGELGIPVWKVPRLMRSVRNRLQHRMQWMAPFPGMARTLHALRAAGCRTAVVSSNSRRNIDAFFTRHGLHGFDMLSCSVGLFGKPRRLRRLLASLEIPAVEACYIGDEIRDIEAAAAAGTASIAVSWGYSHRDALRAARPDHIVDTPEQLASVILDRRG